MRTTCTATLGRVHCERASGHEGRHEKFVGGGSIVEPPGIGGTGYDVIWWPAPDEHEIKPASEATVARCRPNTSGHADASSNSVVPAPARRLRTVERLEHVLERRPDVVPELVAHQL